MVIKKIYKAVILLCVIFALSLSFCSCSDEYGGLDKRVKKIVDLTAENDAQGVFELVDHTAIDSEKMEKYFPKMHDMLKDTGAYFIQRISVKLSESEGVGVLQARYFLYTVSGDTYEIKVRQVDGFDGFVEFSVFELMGENTENIAPSTEELCVLLYTFACIGFCVWMIVDCMRRFLKKKPVICGLLCALIIFGISARFIFGSGGFNIMPGISLGFMPSDIFVTPKLAKLKLVFPVGAIVYFILRKKLSSKITQRDAEGTGAVGGQTDACSIDELTDNQKFEENTETNTK